MINFASNPQDCINEWADFCLDKLTDVKNDCQASAMARDIPQEVASIQIYEWFHAIGRDLLISLLHMQKYELDDMPDSELKDTLKHLKKEWDTRIKRHKIEYDFIEKNQQKNDNEEN